MSCKEWDAYADTRACTHYTPPLDLDYWNEYIALVRQAGGAERERRVAFVEAEAARMSAEFQTMAL